MGNLSLLFMVVVFSETDYFIQGGIGWVKQHLRNAPAFRIIGYTEIRGLGFP